jgi:hypothetical protein
LFQHPHHSLVGLTGGHQTKRFETEAPSLLTSVALDVNKAVRIRADDEQKYENKAFSEELMAYILLM